MKFKKGDRVKVLNMPTNCVGDFPEDMVGKIVTIFIRDEDNGIYCVDENKWYCNFFEEDLELAKFTLRELIG
jgi:hypothetical protein